jgi:hypothetical protein
VVRGPVATRRVGHAHPVRLRFLPPYLEDNSCVDGCPPGKRRVPERVSGSTPVSSAVAVVQR